MLVVVVLSVAGVLIFLKTFQVSRYKDRIEEELCSLSGRAVKLGRIDLGLSLSGVSLNLENMSMKDSADAHAQTIVSLGQIKVNIDPSALWKNNEIHVPLILVRDLRLHLVKDLNGVLNIVPPAAASSSGPAGEQPPEPSSGLAPERDEPIVIPPVRVDAITFENGEIIFEDHAEAFPMTIDIRRLKVQITDFSLEKAFPFKVQLSLWSGKDNVQAAGQVALNVENQTVHMKDGVFHTDFGELDLKKMAEALPVLQAVPLGDMLQGQVRVSISQLSAGASGLQALKASAALNEGAVALPYRNVTLTRILAEFDMDENDVRLEKFSADVAGGRVTGQGLLRDYLKTPSYSLRVRAEGVALADVLPDINSEVRFLGDLESQMEISGEGVQYPALMDHLKGQGKISLANGRLENFNMLRVILSQLKIVPDLVAVLEARLPEKSREILTRNDTVFTAAGADLVLEPGAIRINPVELVTESFSFSGEGVLDNAYNLLFSSAITLSPELSASIVNHAEELAAIQGADARIRVPLQEFKGPVQALRLLPDVQTLGAKVILDKGKSEVKRFLDKVLESNTDTKDPAPQAGKDLQEGAQGAEEKPAEKQLMENILNSVFGE